MSHNNTVTIGSLRHPFWRSKIADWTKWRFIYDGGPDFVDEYLERFSKREDTADFVQRKRITPTPNFAKAAVNDIKNAIFQRLADVSRTGGSQEYQEAVVGDRFGVDLHGSSMNSFMGREILPELLTMARVGIFIDMPQIEGQTLKDAVGNRPYLYWYRTEDILSWSFRPGRPDEFDNLLLRDFTEIRHAATGLPSGTKERYRFLFIGEDGKVHVQFFEHFPDVENHEEISEKQVDINGNPTDEDIILDLEVIPFVLLEISDSLLSDISNHQIALLNLESSDIAYALLSNFPFYTEQVDSRDYSHLIEGAGQGDDSGTAENQSRSKDREIQVGATHGRTYGKGLDRPDYIHPPSEPLKASMEKQQQLKDDIRQLVNLALSNIKPKMASAESKAIDERGLEAGLSHIGLVLEHTERKIATYWAMYLSTDIPTIKYPERYSLKDDEDRRKDTEQLAALRAKVPSTRFQKLLTIQMAEILIGHKTPNPIMDEIRQEIEQANAFSSDPDTIFEAVDRAILDLESAALLLGYPKETVKAAADDHANRLARIAESQSSDFGNQNAAARGVPDLDDTPGRGAKEERKESQDQTQRTDTGDRTRGEARETEE